MQTTMTKEKMKQLLTTILDREFSVSPQEASNEQYYRALALLVVNQLKHKYDDFNMQVNAGGKKRIYYLCMEFLMGRSLKNNLFNLGLRDIATQVLAGFDVNLEDIYECEPDAGLGNGGLGRLAACYMDALATTGYPAVGYSICYEFGIFRQKIVNGWQTEEPDNWLPGGDVWLVRRDDRTVEVHFDGQVDEIYDDGYYYFSHRNYTKIKAVPYDMYVSGYNSDAVACLRLWKAESDHIDMESFNKGDYVRALGQNSMNEAISKILYPNDNHIEGKSLRLRQQYFLTCASISDIVTTHMKNYRTLENLADKVAIHINDTHPALAIPELMRVLLDDCGYSWEKSWDIVTRTFAYTNHTVLSEALEKWNEDLFKSVLPRIYQIVKEINERYCRELYPKTGGDLDMISRMSICAYHQIRMANLSVCASHHVNGVSELHSQIIKDDVFKDFYALTPEKFTNVTNGIAARRWLNQSNPGLTSLLQELIGAGFEKDMANLSKLKQYANDTSVLERLGAIKHENKLRLARYIHEHMGIDVNCDSIFDVQVKRLHEYKRQHLNALNIVADYLYLLQNPNAPFTPKTYIFGAKAAPGYFFAKQIIRMICMLSKEIEQNPKIREKLRVVYLEDYRVTLSELLMPASEISEQISLAGYEASGTGNMKLMLNGALTMGTLDGANVEIKQAVGDDNIFIFGMKANEVEALKAQGYHPATFYQNDEELKAAVDRLNTGFAGVPFGVIADNLLHQDPYMVLADFRSYRDTQGLAGKLYQNAREWNQKSLMNIAGAGIFSADRAVKEYAQRIWGL